MLAIAYGVITRAVLVPAAFRLRAVGNNAETVQALFQSVQQWWGINDLLHVIAFALSLCAFAEVASGSKQGRSAAAPDGAHG